MPLKKSVILILFHIFCLKVNLFKGLFLTWHDNLQLSLYENVITEEQITKTKMRDNSPLLGRRAVIGRKRLYFLAEQACSCQNRLLPLLIG